MTAFGSYVLPPRQRTELLGGVGDAAAVAALGSARVSVNLAMLRALIDAGQEHAHVREAMRRTGFAESFAALSRVQDVSPFAVRSVLGYPYVGSWLAACLAAVRESRSAGSESTTRHLAHLGALALAAGASAGVPVEAAVPVTGARIALPGLGSVAVDAGWHGRLVTARISDGWLELAGDGTTSAVRVHLSPDEPRWTPVRRLELVHRGRLWRLIVDDADPYRSQPGLDAPESIPDHEVAAWSASLTDAWAVLVDRHRDQADALAAGLRVLTPMRAGGSGASMSATGRHSFGAVSMTRPPDGIRGACRLLHEFQHLKLNGLAEVVRLLDAEPDALCYPPWREDPRPLIGLLHGTYAWLAVTRFWANEGHARPADAVAEFELARSRRQLLLAARTARAAGAVTPSGLQILVAAERLATDHHHDAEGSPVRVAQDVVLHHALHWRLRHLTPDDGGVRALAARWRTGRPADRRVVSVLTPLVLDGGTADTFVRRAVDAVGGRPTDVGGQPENAAAAAATTPESLLVLGDYSGAAAGFERDVAAGSTEDSAWAGLAVAHARLGDERRCAWVRQPELVRALFVTLHTSAGDVTSPAAVDHWLSAAVLPSQGTSPQSSGCPDSPDGFAVHW